MIALVSALGLCLWGGVTLLGEHRVRRLESQQLAGFADQIERWLHTH